MSEFPKGLALSHFLGGTVKKNHPVPSKVKALLPPQVQLQDQDYLVVKLPLGNYKLGEAKKKLIAGRLQGGADTMEEEQQLNKIKELVNQPLTGENYADRWQFLLHCEHTQRIISILSEFLESEVSKFGQIFTK